MVLKDYKSDFLKNRNILVTGASRGIGKTLSITLSKYGANIIMLGKNEKLLDQIYDEIKDTYNTNPLIIASDLNNLDENKAQEVANVIIEEYGYLDALINNASILNKMSLIEDYDLKAWEKVLKINLTSAFLLSKYSIPIMKNSSIPRIIFTSSSVAKKGKAYWGAYSASKAGAKVLSEIISDELESISKFKIFNFNPKATQTDMRSLAYPAEDPTMIKKPEELIKYYLWMLSSESSYSKSTYLEYGDSI
ncbi:MAG: polyketide synthase [Gammaproteobacteria bacterium]|nr:polyketide synthase [Gammaproteobacteria bacterium]|tara:strand:+ start:66671 stop:67420 length:750 start_codon:yes stop_codon:yes gene_type:complete